MRRKLIFFFFFFFLRSLISSFLYLSDVLMCIHTYIYTHTYTHIYIYTYMHVLCILKYQAVKVCNNKKNTVLRYFFFSFSIPSVNTGQRNSLALARRERTENSIITRMVFLVVVFASSLERKELSCRKDRIIRYQEQPHEVPILQAKEKDSLP